MDFVEYQRRAVETDQNPGGFGPTQIGKDVLIPLLGMGGEVGNLLSEYKKLLRDGPVHLRFREQAAEELGDILWYLANTASKFGLSLEEIARANLRKTRDRWRSGRLRRRKRFDQGCPPHEQLPRHFEFSFAYRRHKGLMKVILLDEKGMRVGDPLTDNAMTDDGYRFHDVLHLALATLLGWSPVIRKLLGRKRKSRPKVDEVQDGGRAAVVEEGIVAAAYEYATRHQMFAGATTIDYELLRYIKRLTANLEVSVVPVADWERAILKGFEVWRQIHTHRGGRVRGNMSAGTFEFVPPTPAQRPRAGVKRSIRSIIPQPTARRSARSSQRRRSSATG